MTQPTKNSIPSGNILDQIFNAEKIDEVVNSDNETYTDRLGVKRFTLTGLYSIVQNWLGVLGSQDGLKNIGQCQSIEMLKTIEPAVDGQQIFLVGNSSDWRSLGSTPWGGGIFKAMSNLPAEVLIDDGGSVVKTNNGKFWIREELLRGDGVVKVEWYLKNPPSLTTDISSEVQKACDFSVIWASKSKRNAVVTVKMPPLMNLSKTINVQTRGVRIDGGGGFCVVNPAGSYTQYSSLSSNSSITNTPDGNVPPVAVINLTHGSTGGVPNPAYTNQVYIKDWNLILGTATGDFTYTVNPLGDNGITAICHWGTSTVGGAQFTIENTSVQGFGVGYINGNNIWGGDFLNCKWVGCFIPVWLIEGADNTERFSFTNCVMQNGYRCIYSPWPGDIKIVSGSYVWNTGPYFSFPTAGNVVDITPSRIEMVGTNKPLIEVGTSIETGATAQKFPLVSLHNSMVLLDSSSLLTDGYLFSVGKYSKLIVRDNTWSNKNMTNLAKIKLLNPQDTKGQVIFKNNTCRVGIFSEMGRDNRLLTSKTPAGRIQDITIGGGNAANGEVSVNGGNLTFNVKNSAASGTLTLLLRVPIDVDMSDWDSFSWKAVFSAITISGDWTVNAFASVSGTSYPNNRLDLGSVNLKTVEDISDVSSLNNYGFRKIVKRADGGWDRVPTEVYLYFSSGTSQTAGDTFTLSNFGLLGY